MEEWITCGNIFEFVLSKAWATGCLQCILCDNKKKWFCGSIDLCSILLHWLGKYDSCSDAILPIYGIMNRDASRRISQSNPYITIYDVISCLLTVYSRRNPHLNLTATFFEFLCNSVQTPKAHGWKFLDFLFLFLPFRFSICILIHFSIRLPVLLNSQLTTKVVIITCRERLN